LLRRRSDGGFRPFQAELVGPVCSWPRFEHEDDQCQSFSVFNFFHSSPIHSTLLKAVAQSSVSLVLHSLTPYFLFSLF
jgi:hypothetical protein